MHRSTSQMHSIVQFQCTAPSCIFTMLQFSLSLSCNTQENIFIFNRVVQTYSAMHCITYASYTALFPCTKMIQQFVLILSQLTFLHFNNQLIIRENKCSVPNASHYIFSMHQDFAQYFVLILISTVLFDFDNQLIIRNPNSIEIFRKYCKNISWKYCKIAKIFRHLSLMLLKYCNNLTVSSQNMTYGIFSKYCQNQQVNKQYFFK